MHTTLETLNHTGHMTMTWDHGNEAEAKAAREAIEKLRSEGYSFFLADGTGEGDASTGKGHLVVQKLTPKEVAGPEGEEPETKTKGKRGRRVVAVRPLAGG